MAFDFKNASKEARDQEYKKIARLIGDDQFFTKKELNHLPEVLSEGEQVLAFSSGFMDGNTWLIVLTDERVIFLDKGMIYGLKQVSISLEKINSISGKTGILLGEIAIEDGASTRVIKNVQKKVVVPFTNMVRNSINEKENKNKPTATSLNMRQFSDPVERIEKLSLMLSKGLITDAEFSEQRQRILNDI